MDLPSQFKQAPGQRAYAEPRRHAASSSKPISLSTSKQGWLFELCHDEYPYFQEVERLSRYISFLAFECYVNYEFFHKLTPSPPYAKIGVKVKGYSTRCLFFGLYFKQLRRCISLLIERNVPVSELKNHREFRNFLQISPDAYQWLLENSHSLADSAVKMELRPPGPATCPLVRISGPRDQCQELWERHLRAVPSDDGQTRACRDPLIAEVDPRTQQRRGNPSRIFGREVDASGTPLDGEPLDPVEPSADKAESRAGVDTWEGSTNQWSRGEHFSDRKRDYREDRRAHEHGDWRANYGDDRKYDHRSTNHNRSDQSGDWQKRHNNDWGKDRNYRQEWNNDNRWRTDNGRGYPRASNHHGRHDERHYRFKGNRHDDYNHQGWQGRDYAEKNINQDHSQYAGPPARPLQPGALVIGPGVIPTLPFPPLLPAPTREYPPVTSHLCNADQPSNPSQPTNQAIQASRLTEQSKPADQPSNPSQPTNRAI